MEPHHASLTSSYASEPIFGGSDEHPVAADAVASDAQKFGTGGAKPARQAWEPSMPFTAVGEGTTLLQQAVAHRFREMKAWCKDNGFVCYVTEASVVGYLGGIGSRYLDCKSWTPVDCKPEAHLSRDDGTLPPECYHSSPPQARPTTRPAR